ncbi:leucine-rich PPR motif-containing protein, mitochondrial [Toxorhynchites rutilus septentrionalis]|uniref:leucine-rich PPR motif-containing protein, mitochondrial n=1 Tax=Toxorhynchites rutilus septentrionalis TaxID=329112 RepID=UPI00247ABCA1|nr:leucine-rich PPR motif-containing protein, mitochondrial [Toxorhynchites rutilus septentrionalis]
MNILRNCLTRRWVLVGGTYVRPISHAQRSPIRCLHNARMNQLLPASPISVSTIQHRLFTAQVKTSTKPVITQVSLIDELKGDVMAHRRVHLDKLQQAISKPEATLGGSYDFLLGCCGRLLVDQPAEVRMNLFKSIWHMAGEPTSTTSLDRWKTMLRVYRENGSDINGGVGEFLEDVKCEKDEEFYRLLLAVVSERGDEVKMQQIMKLLEAQDFGLDVSTGRILIRGHFKAGNLQAVSMMLDTMRAADIELDGGIYGELAIGYLMNKQTDKFSKMIKEKAPYLTDYHIMEALKGALIIHEYDAVKQLVTLLPEEVTNDSKIHPSLRNICTELFGLKQFEAVRALLNELPIPRFNANESSDGYGVSLISEMIRTGAPFGEIRALVDFLIKTERNTRALHVACDCAIKVASDIYPQLLVALHKQEDLRPHYFWPLIVQNFTDRGEAGVLEALKLMQKLRTELDEETISVFVLPKLSITLKDVRTALKQFEDRGVKMSILMTPFVTQLLHQNRFQDACRVVKLYSSKMNTEKMVWPLVLQASAWRSSEHFRNLSEVIRQLMDNARDPNHDLGGQLLLELLSSKKTNFDAVTLKSLLLQFQQFRIRISRMSANVLLNHFTKTKSADSDLVKLVKSLADDSLTIASKQMFDSFIVHPRDMNYEELECHLNELEEKKMNARGVLRRLLQICIRQNRLERAVEIKRKCDDLKVELSSGMLASVFDMYIKLKDVDKAGKTLAQLQATFPGFLIDTHKIVDFAALLVENGFVENARNVLKQRAARQIVPGYANKNIWNLLTNNAQWAANTDGNSEQNKTYELLTFLVDLGYCSYDNALLGPVIREYLLKNQTRNAIAEFKKIATEKQRTPLQLEIFTLLVRLTNSNDAQIPPGEAKALLGEIIQVTSKIHGPVNTNNTLIVALADAGTDAQLRRILINPETRVNHSYILTQCEFLVNSGKLDVVLRLAKSSRGLANVREADFLGVIVKQYIRDNNCEAAVELFNRLQAEDELKITGELARKLIDLLEINNYEVPSGIRLYAK